MIPMSFSGSSSATAKNGDTASSFGADSSGFNVNYGNGVVQGGSTPGDKIPTYYWLIAAVVAYALWQKRSR